MTQGNGHHQASSSRIIVTTEAVAQILSKDFSIRAGYRVAQSNRERVHETGNEEDQLSRSSMGRLLLPLLGTQKPPSGQITTSSITRVEDVNIGDLVILPAQGKVSQYLLVQDVFRDGLHRPVFVNGPVLISPLETYLHELIPSNELLLTLGKRQVAVNTFSSKLLKETVVVRFGWIEHLPAYITLSEWASRYELLHSSTSLPTSPSQKEKNLPEAGPIDVHEGDFVLMKEAGKPLLSIFQICRFRDASVTVRRMHRQALTEDKHFRNDLLLIPDCKTECFTREEFTPRDKVFVKPFSEESSSFSSSPDHFFISKEGSKTLSAACRPCSMQYESSREQRKTILKKPLATMELFCGAGGLSLGLTLSGACETKWAIDTDLYCTQTFSRHHPKAEVFRMDAGTALECALMGRSGDGKTFPKPAEVDVIVGGPPCQGVSKLNRHAPREAANQDCRNLLVASMLGWVDHLRPKYFVLENVNDFVEVKLGGREQGLLKFTMHALMKLGYGICSGFVQAGAYGCPQSRGRLVILAARKGLVLPKLPRPSHSFSGRPARRLNWKDANNGTPHIANPFGDRSDGVAPLPSITIRDAIIDLPEFDWKDPHVIYPGFDSIEAERERKGIPQVEVKQKEAVGSKRQQYKSAPRNNFQERMRIVQGQCRKVLYQHQTSGASPCVVERVVNVSLDPGSDYDSWSHPSVNKPNLLARSKDTWDDAFFKYARLDYESYFKALMTTIPAQGSFIHPDQRRLLTVRECARAQGIPDFVRFASDANLKAAYKQIGNAVPVPLAQAIGNAIIAARMESHGTTSPTGSSQEAAVTTCGNSTTVSMLVDEDETTGEAQTAL